MTVPMPPRPPRIGLAAYLFTGAAALWSTAGCATLFVIPEYARHYADLRQDAGYGTAAGALLVLFAVVAAVTSGAVVGVALPMRAGRSAARTLAFVLGGVAVAVAVAVLTFGVFTAVPWHRWLMASTAALTIMLLVPAGVLVATAPSRAWFRLAAQARAMHLAHLRFARQQAMMVRPPYPYLPPPRR